MSKIEYSQTVTDRIEVFGGKKQRMGEVTFYHWEFVDALSKSCRVLMIKSVYRCTICGDLNI